jgi:hypothetical protein
MSYHPRQLSQILRQLDLSQNQALPLKRYLYAKDNKKAPVGALFCFGL